MNKRDADILDALLVKLTAHFAEKSRQVVDIGRGEARAIIAAIRERNDRQAAAAPRLFK